MSVPLDENDQRSPPPAGLKWREMAQQSQGSPQKKVNLLRASAPSMTTRLDKSYESLTNVTVEDFLKREAAVQRWIEECLSQRPQRQPNLPDLLSNGVVLCQLMSTLDQGSIPRIHTGKMLELGFKRRENIIYFLEALRENKVPPGFIFHVDDLYQNQNFYRVVECLEYLSELAYQEWGAPYLRKTKLEIKKLVDEGEIIFTNESYQRAEQVVKEFLTKKKWFLVPKTDKPPGSPWAKKANPLSVSEAVTVYSRSRRGIEGGGTLESMEGQAIVDEDGCEEGKEAEKEDNAKTEETKEAGSCKEDDSEMKKQEDELKQKQQLEEEIQRLEGEKRRLTEEVRKRNEAVRKGVIRLQSLYRGRRERLAFRTKLRAAAYRESVANEIFQTEKDYVDNLCLLFDTFLHPIKEHMAGSVWLESVSSLRNSDISNTSSTSVELIEFKDLFANIRAIRDFNANLLEELEPRIHNWTPHQRLGDIFVKVAIFLKMYTAYVKNYDAMRRELTQAKATSPQFQMFLLECAEANRERVGKQDINSLLIQPVQRIPRYLLLLRELTKHTEPDHKDYADLNKALAQIKEVAEYIEEKSAQSEMVHKMISIQSRFQGKFQSLIEPGRRFIREGQLLGWNVNNKRKQNYVIFLFNDLLVLARPAKEQKNWRKTIGMKTKPLNFSARIQETTQDLIFCRSFLLRHLIPTSLADSSRRGYCFGLAPSKLDQPMVKFYTQDLAEKESWLSELQKAINTIVKENKVRKDMIQRTLGRNRSLKGMSSVSKELGTDDTGFFASHEGLPQHLLPTSPRARNVADPRSLWTTSPQDTWRSAPGISKKPPPRRTISDDAIEEKSHNQIDRRREPKQEPYVSPRRASSHEKQTKGSRFSRNERSETEDELESDAANSSAEESQDKQQTSARGQTHRERERKPRRSKCGLDEEEDREKEDACTIVVDAVVDGLVDDETAEGNAPTHEKGLNPGRSRGHLRSRSATIRSRLQLSPRKAFEVISPRKKSND